MTREVSFDIDAVENSLDLVERELDAAAWSHERDGFNSVHCIAPTRWGDLGGVFTMRDDPEALFFSVTLDVKPTPTRRNEINELLIRANEKLWLGHFDFWPGDGLQGGYGDQMDVGLKLSGDAGAIHYDAAYYHQDDWGEDSTDTVDDNGHWGSSATYRKIKTGVLNVDWTFLEHHTVGASAQYGRMQDLVPVAANNPSASNDEGTHQAYDLHYMFQMDNWSAKYRFISVERDFDGMDALLASADAPVDDKIENQRHVVEVGYNHNNWFYYVDAGVASTDTTGNDADDVQFIAPGVRYQYGPGWIYFEYLQSDGDINAYGDVYESDFDAVYVAFDFYF